MNHGLDGYPRSCSSRKGTVKISWIADIPLNHLKAPGSIGASESRHTLESFRGTIGEIVENNQLMAGFKEHQTGVTTNKTRAASDQDLGHGSGSLHRHAFREIARLIHIEATMCRDVITQQLHRNHR